MSGELVSLDNRAALLAGCRDGTLVCGLTRAQLRDIERYLKAAVIYEEAAAIAVRNAAGPELHGLPAHLFTMISMGAGYLRHARDIIRAMRAAPRRKPAKPR